VEARWSPGVSEFSEGKMQGVPEVSWSSHITLTHQNHTMHHNAQAQAEMLSFFFFFIAKMLSLTNTLFYVFSPLV